MSERSCIEGVDLTEESMLEFMMLRYYAMMYGNSCIDLGDL